MKSDHVQLKMDLNDEILSQDAQRLKWGASIPSYEHVVCQKNLLTGLYCYSDLKPLKGKLKAFIGILTAPHIIPEYSLKDKLGFIPDTLVLHYTNYNYWYVVQLKREVYSKESGFYIIGMKKNLIHIFYFPSYEDLKVYERMEIANRIIPELKNVPWVNTVK